MDTDKKVLALLEENAGAYLSGEALAGALFVTRAAVWKAIRRLREEGFAIDAVTNRGYRLRVPCAAPEPGAVAALLEEAGVPLPVLWYGSVPSTNDACEQYARTHGGPCLILAGAQTEGRGRRGRSFFSPAGTGLYFSVLFYPKAGTARLTDHTAYAAVAAARAIDETVFSGEDTVLIKWVNDLFCGGRKVAGILTEARTALEDGSVRLIVGIGIDLYPPEGGFPKELTATAGALLPSPGPDAAALKNALIARTVAELFRIADGDDAVKIRCLETYRKKSLLIGSFVKIADAPPARRYARVTGISDDYRLEVLFEDGTAAALSGGEVSVVKY